MRRTTVIGAVAVTIIGGACDSLPTRLEQDPLEPADPSPSRVERVVEEELRDLTGALMLFPCNEQGELVDEVDDGEIIELEGSVYERFTLLYDAAGAIHVNWQTMPVGLRGIGQRSGEEFRVTDRSQGGTNQTQMGTTSRYRSVLELRGRDTGRAFSLVSSGHYTVNANGEFVVDRDSETAACLP